MRKDLTAGIVAVGTVVLVVALLAAGGAPQPIPDGFTGPGQPASWAVPVLRLGADLAAIACAGAVLAAAVLLLPREATDTGGRLSSKGGWGGAELRQRHPRDCGRRGRRRPAEAGKLAAEGIRACQDAAIAAAVWAVASIAGLVTTAAVILGIPVAHLLDHAELAGGVAQVRALAATVVLTALLAVVLSGARTLRTARISLVLIAFALIPPLLTGHGAIDRRSFWSVLATSSLVVHVFAATVWIGGLVALLRYTRERDAVERFSRLALGCAIAIGITGLLTAEIHLGGREDGWGLITQWVTTGYGALVFAKAIAFAVLVCIGWWHRRSTLPALADRPVAFWRLAAGELLLMAATVGLAVALSRTP